MSLAGQPAGIQRRARSGEDGRRHGYEREPLLLSPQPYRREMADYRFLLTVLLPHGPCPFNQ